MRAIRPAPRTGKRLYVGGEFNKVNGVNRAQLVALDPATGEIDQDVQPASAEPATSPSIAVHGSQIYIGGSVRADRFDAPGGVAALCSNLSTATLNVQFVPAARGTRAGSRAQHPQRPT